MMEGFIEDAEEYERRHMESWLGRHGGYFGAGMSMQIDLLSPTSIYDFTRDPSLFNLAKMGYLPGLNYAGMSAVGFLTGEKMLFTERLVHSVDMTIKTYKAAGQAAGRAAMFAVRRTPGMIAGAALFGAGMWLQSMYYDLSGMYIGDIRFSR